MVLLPLLSFSPEGIPGRLLSSSSVLPFVMATHNLLLTELSGHVLDPLMDLLSEPILYSCPLPLRFLSYLLVTSLQSYL